MEPAFTLACAIRLNGSKCELPSLSLPSGTDRGAIGDVARLHFGLCRPAEQAQCELLLLSLLQAPMRFATRLQSNSNVCTKRPPLLARAGVCLLPCGAARRQCLLQTSVVADPCKLIVEGLLSARRTVLCAIRRHRSITIPVVRLAAYHASAAWIVTYRAGMLKVSSMICVMRSRFALWFNGAPSATLGAPPEPNEACVESLVLNLLTLAPPSCGASPVRVATRVSRCSVCCISFTKPCLPQTSANSRKLNRDLFLHALMLLDDGPPCKGVIALFPLSFSALSISTTAHRAKGTAKSVFKQQDTTKSAPATGQRGSDHTHRRRRCTALAIHPAGIYHAHRTAGIIPHSPSAGITALTIHPAGIHHAHRTAGIIPLSPSAGITALTIHQAGIYHTRRQRGRYHSRRQRGFTTRAIRSP